MQSQVSLGDLEIEPKITVGVSVGGSATSIMPKCESDSVKVKVWKWKCESESVKVKVWK